jgi:ATP-binding cassette subfamily F protein 3
VSTFDGDLDDYQKHLMDEAKRMREALRLGVSTSAHTQPSEEVNQKLQRQQAAQRRQAVAEQTRPWRKELEKIDAELLQLNQERDQLQGLALNPQAIQDMAEWGRRCKAVDDRIGQLEERWLELSEMVEMVEGLNYKKFKDKQKT